MTDPGEGELALAREACVAIGLAPGELRRIRVHSNGVFLHPAAELVVRVGGGFDAAGRVRRAVAVTRWLNEMHFPTVVPVPGVEQPIILSGDVPVTFWQHVDASGGAVAAADLGRLLQHLHRMPAPPLTLPQFRPLDRLTATAADSRWLSAADQRWLLEQATILQQQLKDTKFRLGPPGLVHGDAQLDNVIPAVPGPVLADWDAAAAAPREWDLVPAAAEQRFGGSAQVLADLLDAYGADPTGDPGWPVLISTYELRSVAAHIRRAPVSPPHARQAALRIASLRAGDRSVRWSGIG